MLILGEAHTSGSAIVSVRRLDPLVPHVVVTDHVCGLFANLSIVMNVVPQSEGVVSLVDVWSVLHVVLVETLLHGGVAVHWELWLVMREVGILEELNPLWGDVILGTGDVDLLELGLLLRNTTKSAISCLEVGPSDVGGGEWVQAGVDLPACI